MRFVFFTHSLVSDWNHGNAHFLRGTLRALHARGHATRVFEPAECWSRQNLLAEDGETAIDEFHSTFPDLASETYGERPDLDAMLEGAEAVLVHEWNPPDLIAAIGRHRAQGGRYTLLFHDTHHRSVTAPHEIDAFDLSAYDGVLAFGATIAREYEKRGWGGRAFVWHEAADVTLFRPRPDVERRAGGVWIGNWGDEERTEELRAFLFEPARAEGIVFDIHGVRYPDEAKREIAEAGFRYHGWLPNWRVPEVFARHRLTVHVPRRPYARALPGIPTIRVFEALACGIPLLSAPWEDTESLFRPGEDFLVARDGAEMAGHMRAVLRDDGLVGALAASGRETVLARHTCDHRADELLTTIARLRGSKKGTALAAAKEQSFQDVNDSAKSRVTH